MKLFFNALLVLIVTVAAVFYWAVQPEKPAASQAWFNGTILTMDDQSTQRRGGICSRRPHSCPGQSRRHRSLG